MSKQRIFEIENQIDDIYEMLGEPHSDDRRLRQTLYELERELKALKQAEKRGRTEL